MGPKSFVQGLILTTCIQVALCAGLAWGMRPLQAHTGFVAVSIFVLMLFCVTIYIAARILARSTLTRLYIQLVMVAVFLKMLVCLALIIGYKKGFEPADNTFVWPFLIIYLSTTIYEVIFLEKVGREKQTPAS